jgi:hypothetical protein
MRPHADPRRDPTPKHSHEKIIAYYTWLRDTADGPERRRFQERIDIESDALRRHLE